MPSFKVNGSCMRAEYQTGALVIHHDGCMFKLKAPLDCAQIDKLSVGQLDYTLYISLKDRTELVLQPMSKKEVTQLHAAHALELRAAQHQHAKKALLYARRLQAAAKGLVEVQRRLDDDATEIAGEFYESFHTVSFELEGSNFDQIERGHSVAFPDFESVERMADRLVTALEPFATADEPPPLLGEQPDLD